MANSWWEPFLVRVLVDGVGECDFVYSQGSLRTLRALPREPQTKMALGIGDSHVSRMKRVFRGSSLYTPPRVALVGAGYVVHSLCRVRIIVSRVNPHHTNSLHGSYHNPPLFGWDALIVNKVCLFDEYGNT